MRTCKYLLLYLLIIELTLPFLVPLGVAYHYRMNYAVVKDNTGNIEIILDQIERQIRSKQLHDYIIILGDSVAYSGPGPSSQSLGVYLEAYYRQKGKKNSCIQPGDACHADRGHLYHAVQTG